VSLSKADLVPLMIHHQPVLADPFHGDTLVCLATHQHIGLFDSSFESRDFLSKIVDDTCVLYLGDSSGDHALYFGESYLSLPFLLHLTLSHDSFVFFLDPF
jgi:hypothetical protein